MLHQKIESSRLQQLYGHWREKCGSRTMPILRDINPAEMSEVLPSVFILDVEDDPRRLHIRLAGTGLADKYGEDYTGWYVDAVDLGKMKDKAIATFFEVADTVTPSCITGQYEKADGRIIRFERLAMPLSKDGLAADIIIGGIHYVPIEKGREVPAPDGVFSEV